MKPPHLVAARSADREHDAAVGVAVGQLAQVATAGRGCRQRQSGEEGGRLDPTNFGRYELLGVIGQGGMGQVLKAHDTAVDRDVAIKVLPPDLADEPGYRERFRREAHIAARLIEPHVIPIYDTGEIDGHLYLVMPVIDGVDVHSLLKRDGPMSPDLAVRVIEQLAAALDAAHANGLVHRDVKPSNALMTSHEFVYLIDFGIAHNVAATKLTSTGTIVGTLAYLAPERFTTGVADARSDVYALACVLYECLTGEQPFPGESMEQQVAGHLAMDPPRPSVRGAAVPAAFDDVIARGMAKSPDQRYQSAGDLAVAARAALTWPFQVPAAVTPGSLPKASTLLANPAASMPFPPGTQAASQPRDRRSRVRRSILFLAILLVLLLAGAGVFEGAKVLGSKSRVTSASKAASTSGQTTNTGPEAPLGNPGHTHSIDDYLNENGIAAVRIHPGDHGAPTIRLPQLDGWIDAGAQAPPQAYSGILHTDPQGRIDAYVFVSLLRLTGNVDPQKIIAYAPGELYGEPRFKPTNPGSNATLDGYAAYQLGGNWVESDGQAIEGNQLTVVIPTARKDQLYVLQIVAKAVPGASDILQKATDQIFQQTAIIVP